MIHDILETVRAELAAFAVSLARLLPRILSALVILVLGWSLAAALRAITRRVLGWVRFNALAERMGATELLQKANAAAPDRIAASAVFWLTWLTVIAAAMQALGFAGAELLMADVVRSVPRIASGVFVLVLGIFLSNLAWRAALLGAVKAQMRSAKLLGALVRALTLIAAIAMALEQVQVGRNVIQTAFAIAFGAVMLAAAIAFGLGGRDLARRYLEQKLLARRKDDDRDEPSHL